MPISESRQNKERRRKLLDCAVALFAEKGYSETPVREIIATSGFGTGTFYNYFVDKEDVLKALLEEFADQIISSVSNYYTTEQNPYKRFIETKRVTMEVFARNEKLSEIYSRVAGTSDEIDTCLKHFEDRLIEFSAKNIEYGIKNGTFNDIPLAPVAHAILATEKFLLYKWLVLRVITKEEMIDMVVSFHETLAKGLVRHG